MKLVVLDGPEYRARGLIRRRDAHLVHSSQREVEFACHRGFAARLDLELSGQRGLVGVGSSLGALALLHQHWTRPGPFAGLLLQSGSFFHRDTERYERDLARFAQVHRFVDRVLAGRRPPPHISVTMTCGLGEQNLTNNRAVAEALAEQGWDVRLVEHPGGHDWDPWRLVLREELPRLVSRSARLR